MDRKRVNLQRAALLSMEMQRGVVGDLAPNRVLADTVQRTGIIPRLATLMNVARAAKATVVHCTATFRPDLKGSARNAPLLGAVTKDPSNVLIGSPGAEVVPALGPEPEDLVFHRFHGLAPFTGTSLDITLRNLGVDTVVATGVSVNVGVMGMCLEAVNLGYRVVLARDCVVGVPEDYAEAVIKNSLSMLATIGDSTEIAALWKEVG